MTNARATIGRLAADGGRRIASVAGVTIDHGEGAYVYDVQGRRYIDAVSGYGVASLGHSHPRWVERVTEQIDRLAISTFDTTGHAQYLERLAGTLPPELQHVALLTGGAEAVEVAVRLAQTVRNARYVVAFRQSFHGKTAGTRYMGGGFPEEAVAIGPPWIKHAPFPACERHDAVDYDKCDESASRMLASLESELGATDVAAVLVEPILGTAGNVPPQRRFLRELRQLCTRRGWLLIFDESITGFGRTGELFAFNHFAVVPDILVLGKGMGAGFPVSGVCASGDLWQNSPFARPSATSTSYGASPLACAAGAVTLEVIAQPPFLRHVRSVSEHAAARLRALADSSPHVALPRGVGLMLGFDLVEPKTGELASAARCRHVLTACRDRGALIAADVPRVRLTPALTLTHDEADALFDVLDEVCS